MRTELKRVKMTVETPQGMVIEFSNVELSITANIETSELYGNPFSYYFQGPSTVNSMNIEGLAFKDEDGIIMTATMKPKKKKKGKK